MYFYTALQHEFGRTRFAGFALLDIPSVLQAASWALWKKLQRSNRCDATNICDRG